MYQNVIKSLIKDIDNSDLTCICLEKPGYMSGDIYKKWVSSSFPKIFLQKKDHTDFLIPRVKQKLKDVFKDYNIDSVVDSGYTSSPWLLLGCVKDIKYDGYKISKIFDSDMNIVNIDTLLDYKIYNKDTNIIPINNNNLEENLPRILSIRVWGRECYICELKEELETIKINQQKKEIDQNKKKSKYTNDKNLSIKLLNILSSDRSDDHNNNYTIGMILYNIFNGSKEGLTHWINSSQKIQKPHKTRGTSGNLNIKYYEKEWIRMDIQIILLEHLNTMLN